MFNFKRKTKEEKVADKSRRKEEERQSRTQEKERDRIYNELIAYEKQHRKETKVAPQNSYISLQHINKIYANHVQAVFDFNLEIAEKEFIVFVGPSGCGKSTTLRMIAGLEKITSGDLFIDGVYSNDLEPKDRDVSMVFQSYALYPHMTVYQNMAFGLQVRHISRDEIDTRIKKAAKILEIEDYLDRKPKALSGGQCQRVALGRAIVRNSKVFLMDEPLSNLDAKLRVQMRAEIVNLHNELGATTIYVTHDQTEAMTMASRIVVMKAGYIQQIGTPKEIYNHPANVFVATFIGSPAMNILKGVFKDGAITFNDGHTITLPPVIVTKYTEFYGSNLPKEVLIGIRPEEIHPAGYHGNASETIHLVVSVAELLGNEYHLHAKFGQAKIIARISDVEEIKSGDVIDVVFDLAHIHLFDKESEKCIC